MLYLLLDYVKEDSDFIKILKIGYSNKKFWESRESDYNTHNYGYKFIGEIEGDIAEETRLHNKYKHLAMPGSKEWFRYSTDIVNEFSNSCSVNSEDIELYDEGDEDLYKELLRLSRKYRDKIVDPDFLLGTYNSIYRRIYESISYARLVWKDMIEQGLSSYEDEIAEKVERTTVLKGFYDKLNPQEKHVLANKLSRCTSLRDYLYIEISDNESEEDKFVECWGLEKLERLAAELYLQDKAQKGKS